MALRKPPKLADLSTGFPYRVFWEEFDDSWERFRIDRNELKRIRQRFLYARILGAEAHLCITQAQIEELLDPFGLQSEAALELASCLYWYAGMFLSREHGKLLNSGPEAVRKRLAHVSKAAKALYCALPLLTPEALALLMTNRAAAPNTGKPNDAFQIGALSEVTRDLALTSDYLIDQIPRSTQGRSVDNLRDRWIWSAASVVEYYTGTDLRAPQTDTVGRNARIEGVEGDIFQSYLRLVSPKLRIGTIVRVLAERRRALKEAPAL